jgi:hypothetical protein
MYKIIGSDQKEYGPVGVEDIRQWIREGRANGQSRVRAEGGAAWQPLQAFPELAALLATAPPVMPPHFYPMSECAEPVKRTNGMAITGFVFSLLGLVCCSCGVFPALGLIFSIVGLIQTNRDPRQDGRGLAVAGIIISLLVLFWAIVVVMMFAGISQATGLH